MFQLLARPLRAAYGAIYIPSTFNIIAITVESTGTIPYLVPLATKIGFNHSGRFILLRRTGYPILGEFRLAWRPLRVLLQKCPVMVQCQKRDSFSEFRRTRPRSETRSRQSGDEL